jgi:uracil-DNA glycosylase
MTALRSVTVVQDDDPREWLRHAARLLAARVPPHAITWQRAGDAQGDLFGTPTDVPSPPADTADGDAARDDALLRALVLPEGFMPVLRRLICHIEADKHALLYRLLWRMQAEPRLLHLAHDPDVRQLHLRERELSRAAHKMKAFLRFRHRPEDDVYVAWFDPGHPLLKALARFFVDRYASQRWVILTPYGSASWDGRQLAFGPPAPRGSGPQDDPCEALWRSYYASIFNPARLKVRAMTSQMPQRYWRDLPEAPLIAGLVREAGPRTQAMVEKARRQAAATVLPPDASLDG